MSNGARKIKHSLHETVEALSLTLHGQQVGILTHYSGGKNILSFDPEYVALSADSRPTYTLSQKVNADYFKNNLIHNQRLAPVLSNLLPEGALREWMSSNLKVHPDHAFPLLAWTGRNLPGAIVAEPVALGALPVWALTARDQVEPIQIDVRNSAQKFSLAGVKMKFSSSQQDGRFHIALSDVDHGNDGWIIKTPSTIHRHVPENEYTAMRLAEAIGVNIPEVRLTPLNLLDNLPDIQLPNEQTAYAIRRYDRDGGERIHSEDFAQVFELYAHNKYGKANSEQIALALYRFSEHGLADVQQMARRLLANILLANGDAHLKNWTIIYPDQKHPVLSPAYDIVSTLPYVNNESGIALNMGRKKAWCDIDMNTFETWARRADIPWQAIKVHINDALELARSTWPELIKDLPMHGQHKAVLTKHMNNVTQAFRVTL